MLEVASRANGDNTQLRFRVRNLEGSGSVTTGGPYGIFSLFLQVADPWSETRSGVPFLWSPTEGAVATGDAQNQSGDWLLSAFNSSAPGTEPTVGLLRLDPGEYRTFPPVGPFTRTIVGCSVPGASSQVDQQSYFQTCGEGWVEATVEVPGAFDPGTDFGSVSVVMFTEVGSVSCSFRGPAFEGAFDPGAECVPVDSDYWWTPAVDINTNNFRLALARGVFPHAPNFQGAGFYKNASVLFSGGLTVGTSSSAVQVGYSTRGTLPPGFLETTQIHVVPSGQAVADHQTRATLCPNPAQVALGYGSPSGLIVVQESFAYAQAPDDDYVLLQYTFWNTGTTTLGNLHAAMTMDWDIANATSNLSWLDAVNQLAVAYRATATAQDPASAPNPLVAVVPVSPLTSYYPFGNGLDPSSPSAWFSAISGGIRGEIVVPTDVRHVAGVGPLSIAGGARVSRVFALVGGDNLADLRANALAARQKAATLPPSQGQVPACP